MGGSGHIRWDNVRLFAVVGEKNKLLIAEVNSLEAFMCFAELKVDEPETEKYSKLVMQSTAGSKECDWIIDCCIKANERCFGSKAEIWAGRIWRALLKMVNKVCVREGRI